MSINSKNLRGCLWGWLFLVTLVGFSPLSFKLADQRFIEDIRTDVPSIFPVMVITSDKAQIVHWGELHDFMREHPDYSFLVSPGQETLFNEQLVISYRERSIDAYPKFEVKRLTQGRQFLELGSYGDGAVVGWYEAADKEIYPQRFKAYGPGFAFIVMALALSFSGLTWVIGITIVKIHKWLKKPYVIAA